MTLNRLEDRRRLRESLETLRRDMDHTGAFDAMDQFEKQAAEFVTSSAVAKAFDIASESEAMRARYGRNDWGQGILLARRLAEAGVTFTAVNLSGWDQHVALKPKIDAAVSFLFEDISSHGLLDQVLVVLGGEMSRAPRMASGHSGYAAGRDHWSNAISYVLGGGGVKGGRVVGASDARGEFITERAVTPGELHATIHHAVCGPRRTAGLDRGRPRADPRAAISPTAASKSSRTLLQAVHLALGAVDSDAIAVLEPGQAAVHRHDGGNLRKPVDDRSRSGRRPPASKRPDGVLPRPDLKRLIGGTRPGRTSS